MNFPRSVKDPLKQPFSCFVAIVGGLSLFNLARELQMVSDDTLVSYIDCIYAVSRDFVFAPLETLIGFEMPAWLKNFLVIYAVLARAYASSVGFLISEMSILPERDRFYRLVTKSYPPFDKGPIKKKFQLIDAVVEHMPITRMKPIAKKILMTLSSFVWPYGLGSALVHPILTIETRGPDEVGSPHPSNPNEVELPPLGEHGEFQYSPKFPATGNEIRSIYNARHIFGTFVVAQFLVGTVLVVGNTLLPTIEATKVCATDCASEAAAAPERTESD